MSDSDTLLSMDQAQLPLFAGIDVGGTSIKIGLVDDRGRSVAFTSIPTEQQAGAERAAEQTAAALEQLVRGLGVGPDEVKRIGLVTPGPMDLAAGMLLAPGNLPAWHYTPVRDLFSAACRTPVTFANDANAAAFGEYWAGAGARVRSMVMVTLGTGVGGGIIVNGRVLEGAHGAGAEIGHIVIDCADDAPNNSLNLRGTLEGYVGSYGVVARMQQALAASRAYCPLRDLPSHELTPLAIAEAAEAGDPLALKVVMQTAKYLAIGLASTIHTVDPESVVIGGAMTFGGPDHRLGQRFLEEVRTQTRARLLESLRDAIAIDFARLGSDAGYIGAAGLAREAWAPARHG